MFTAGAKQIVYRKNKDCPNCHKLKINKFKRNNEIFKEWTVPAHKSHIFVKPKRCDYLVSVTFLVSRAIRVIDGCHIEGKVYTVRSLEFELEFL